MGITKYPHGISSFGVPVMGSGGLIEATTGNVYFVDSNTGSDSNDGDSPEVPFATLDHAIGHCTASKADKIILMPGHAETTTAIALDVAGVEIIGLGVGRNRPTLTATAAASDLIDVTAANCRIKNIRLVGAASACTSLISIAAHDFECIGCSLEQAATPLIAVIVTGGYDRFLFQDCIFMGTAAGPDCAIDLQGSGNCVDWTVDNCIFKYDGSSGCDEAGIRSDKTDVGVLVKDCTFIGMDVAIIDFNSSSTGLLIGIRADSNTATGTVAELMDIGQMTCVDCRVGEPTKSGARIPATTSTP
jgi:hypothetical protein